MESYHRGKATPTGISPTCSTMPEPESYGPEGGHMGITLRQTEVDLEDTAARMRRYEAALTEAYAA